MTNTRHAVAAMYAGRALTVAATLLPYVDHGVLTDHIRAGYPSYSEARIDRAATIYWSTSPRSARCAG